MRWCSRALSPFKLGRGDDRLRQLLVGVQQREIVPLFVFAVAGLAFKSEG
jgi:hypothetical protein